MSENKKNDNPITNPVLAYQQALVHQQSMLDQLYSRNNFFMIFQGVVFAGFMQAGNDKACLMLIIALFCVLASYVQVRLAEGARYSYQWACYVVNYLERYLERIAYPDDSIEEKRAFPYHLYDGDIRGKAAAYKKKTDPKDVFKFEMNQPKETIFFSGSHCFGRVFGSGFPSHEYVRISYAFLLFWIVVVLYVLFVKLDFYVLMGFAN